MHIVNFPMFCEWTARAIDANTGEITELIQPKNELVVDGGRSDLAYLLFALAGSASMNCVGIGSGLTAVDYPDTRLVYELIANSSRKILRTESDTNYSAADVVSEATTIGGCTFRKKIVLKAIFLEADSNNGVAWSEAGLFSNTTLPATPTSTSGLMFDRILFDSPFTKTASQRIELIFTIRF